MKILLTALNAKFIHSSLALRCLKAYSKEWIDHIQIAEYTINHEESFILSEIFKQKPDVVCFSCYIWNVGIINTIVKNLKKIMPKVLIVLGGPEVSYDSEAIMRDNEYIDIIIRGEGEATFNELSKSIIMGNNDFSFIDGITYKSNSVIYSNKGRQALNMDEVPFVYNDVIGLNHKIIYYETQRGCPYNCQYCLSSVEKGVRFLSKERVESDLQFFLDNNVRQVKFVDRTFNCNKQHAMNIWKYLIDNDNLKTNFHMEITADIMDDEILQLLKNARPGLFQFEIGVQSTNENTIEAIKRNTSFDVLKVIVNKIKSGGNIHQHLDLIAGLPHENYNSFGKSFDDVYALEPEQFQLGFLKLLKGSGLRQDAEKYGIVYREESPYEVLYTNKLSYGEMLKIKMIEEMVEIFYNSGKALNTLKYSVLFYDSSFKFYEALAQYWEIKEHHKVQHNKMELFTCLYEFLSSESVFDNYMEIIKGLLKLDIYIGDNIKSLPHWLNTCDNEEFKSLKRKFYSNEANINEFLCELKGFSPQQIGRMCHIELFDFDIYSLTKNPDSDVNMIECAILFNYYSKNELSNNCLYYKINL